MNKNGWGLRAELGFILLFLVCLLIATIGLHRLGLLSDKDGAYVDLGEYTSGKGNYDYSDVEAKVSSAAKRYYNDNYPSGTSDTIIVSTATLKNQGYLGSIPDSRNKECKGYAKILNTGVCVSYIKCSTYKTSGYSEDYE